MLVKQTAMLLLFAATTFATVAEDQVAFPGAQGWGRFAKGARASSSPTVYHVTNLNDSGTGSLRDAVSQPNRIIVFDVSGIIKINSRIVFAKNLYVAGHTAPGEGVTVYGDGVSFSGSDNIICRYLRVRMGKGGTNGKDCAGIASGTNMIFDHCSFSWGQDETFSINPDGKGAIGSITLQNCIFGQGLMTHSAGGLIQADQITLYRNFYCDNSTRNNKIKGINQYANNVVYNWSNGAYIMGGDSEGKSYVNIQSNLFINGNSTGASADAFTGANADFHCYGVDNWQDNNKDGIFNPFEITKYSAATREATPYDYPALELYPGNQLLEKNIPTVGASLPYRDQSDCYMVDELMSFGKLGALISDEGSLAIGIPSSWNWWKGSKPVDTDGDGMPDAWEDANGTDKSKNDATVVAANGYLNIENYINSITVDDRQYFLRQPITVASSKSTTTTITLSWRDYTFEEDGFEIEYAEEGTTDYNLAGRTAANATSYVLQNLKSGVFYNVRVRAFGQHNGESQYSEYSTARVSTRPVEADLVDIDSYDPDVTNSTVVLEGESLLWHTDEELSFEWEDVIKPSDVVASGKGIITVSGNGSIGGEASMNKAGTGTLILNNKNSYEGATVVYDGVLEFNSIANGGEMSSIGASKNFAQNWIFDGGTYRYTGGNASTDRNAQVKSASTLEVKSATLTMNGAFEGAGDLTIDGNGTVQVPTTNFFSYKGATTIKGGKLYLSTVEAAKAGIGQSSKIILAGGTLSTKGETSNYETYSFPIEAMEGTYSYYAPNRNCSIKNALTGAGTIEFVIPYLREYFDANLTNFTGKIVANGISSEAGSMFMCSGSTWNLPNTQVYLKGNARMAIWGTNGTGNIGGISGDASAQLIGSSKQTDGSTTIWHVGSANSDEEFRGVINNLPAGLNSGHNGVTSIDKVGTGYWRLTGNNTYTGSTTVSAGTLIVNGTHSGTGAFNVKKEAMLKGKGSIASRVSLADGAILCPGDTLVNGSALRLKGGLSMATGSELIIPLVVDANGKLVANSLTVTGAVSVEKGAKLTLDMVRLGDFEFQKGDAVPVFSNSSFTTAAESFEIFPATPGEGLEWETSTLLVDGMLRVKNEGEEYQGGAITTQSYDAVLDHTYSVQGGANEAGKFLDLDSHYYNNWGNVSWAAQSYTQFTFDIPAAEEITSATYSVTVNCGGSKDGRAIDINYMPAGTPRVNTVDDVPELCAKTGTVVAAYTDVKRSYATKTMDATAAVKAMHEAGQNYVIFIHSNGAAGGQMYGKKASSTNAPKLSITTKYDPSGIENLNVNPTLNQNCIFDLQGRLVTPAKGTLFIVNDKKCVIR